MDQKNNCSDFKGNMIPENLHKGLSDLLRGLDVQKLKKLSGDPEHSTKSKQDLISTILCSHLTIAKLFRKTPMGKEYLVKYLQEAYGVGVEESTPKADLGLHCIENWLNDEKKMAEIKETEKSNQGKEATKEPVINIEIRETAIETLRYKQHCFLKLPHIWQRAIHLLNLIEDLQFYKVIIFTKVHSDELKKYLDERRYYTMILHNKIAHEERAIKCKVFNEIHNCVLITANLTGVDIQKVNFVINFDAPKDAEEYLHRSSLVVGRSDFKSLILTFISDEYELLKEVKEAFKIEMTEFATHKNINEYLKGD